MTIPTTSPPTNAKARSRVRSGPGWYERVVFPRILNRIMDTAATRAARARVCAPLYGEVLEIGFGTGHNLPFLPDTVNRLFAVDPMLKGQQLAAGRIAASPIDVEFVGLDGERLPLPAASVDCVLSTWTLCSVNDPVAAVREVGRVLRPGGSLYFVEHGLSPDENVRRWQHRCNSLQRRISCGCNLDRDIAGTIKAGGMAIETIGNYYMQGDPKLLGWTSEGRATVDSSIS
jgi:SAM-dependent methyltransferase